jgi:hypothetical protein
MVRRDVARDPEQPGRDRRACEPVAPDALRCSGEDFRSDVLGQMSVAGTGVSKAIHASKVLVEKLLPGHGLKISKPLNEVRPHWCLAGGQLATRATTRFPK